MKVLQEHKNKVLISKDYNIFSYGKKRLSPTRLNNLIDEMREKNISIDLPIIIDENFNILDGKYRFEANKKLCAPIYYKVAEKGNFIDFMKAANLQYKPKMKDYAICHSDKASYRKCIEYYNRLPMSFESFMSDFFDLRTTNRKNYTIFKNGDFEMSIHDEYKIKESIKIAEYIHTNIYEGIELGSLGYTLEYCDYLFHNFKTICDNNKLIIDKYVFVVKAGYPLKEVVKLTDHYFENLICEIINAESKGSKIEDVYNEYIEKEWRGQGLPGYYLYELSKIVTEVYEKIK